MNGSGNDNTRSDGSEIIRETNSAEELRSHLVSNNKTNEKLSF